MKIGNIELLNVNCMEYMKTVPDKHFELAIVDPPYGINRGETFGGKNWKEYKKKDWDKCAPDDAYFTQIFRVSKNQIVWGANYYPFAFNPSMGWIFWDKGQDLTMSDGELAFTSFDRALRRIEINRCFNGEFGGLLHPTQKPVRLYKWLLKNYAKEGDKILDTHLGSGSIAIACHDYKFELTGCEIDKDYFDAAVKRLQNHVAQTVLF